MERLSIGSDMVQDMKKMQRWIFILWDESGREGTGKGAYYMVVTLPKGFISRG